MRTGKFITGCRAELRPRRRPPGLEPRAPTAGQGQRGPEEQAGLQDGVINTDGAFCCPPMPHHTPKQGRRQLRGELGQERELSSSPALCWVTWGWTMNLSELRGSPALTGK